jgi:hypothetical protein
VTDSTSREPTSTTPSTATLILKCQRCGSHFEQDFEELLCWQCVAWAELLEQRDSYADAVHASRGGRR